MNKKLSLIIPVLFPLFIVSCSSDDETAINAEEVEETVAEETRNPADRAVFSDPLKRAHDKSQDVEGILEDAEKKRKQDMSDMGL